MSDSRKPNILLITVDSLRFDHMGCYGYHAETCPFLDSIAQHGQLYERAYAAGPTTPHSFPAIMAGAMPFELPSLGVAHADRTVAEAFRGAGYQTAAFNEANPFLLNHFGYGRGFDLKTDYLKDAATPEEAEIVERRSRLVASTADKLGRLGRRILPSHGRVFKGLEKKKVLLKGRISAKDRLRQKEYLSARLLSDVAQWLSATQRSVPFFLWVHLMGTHFPYFSSPKWKQVFGVGTLSARRVLDLYAHIWANLAVNEPAVEEIVSLYDASIRQVDSAVEQLHDALVRRGDLSNTILAVTADHGEEFRDHGDFGHRSKLFDELVRVPLIIGDTGHDMGRLTGPVSLRGLGGALLSRVGVHPQPGQIIPNFDKLLRANDVCFFQAYVSTRPTPRGDDLSCLPILPKRHGCLTRQWKGIYTSDHSEFELFDWATDPGEISNCAAEQKRAADVMYQLIRCEDRRCEASRLVRSLKTQRQ